MGLEAPPKWPQSPSPLRTRERIVRAVHAVRVAVRSAVIDWRSVKHTRGKSTISGNVAFRVEIEGDELDGGYVAQCLDLPGCISQGETEQEAVENLVEAIIGVLEARMQRHLKKRPLHSSAETRTLSYPHRHTLEIPVT
jgi:predicted RNase H-like HicB family nuclease